MNGTMKAPYRLVVERCATSETLPKVWNVNQSQSAKFNIAKTGKTPLGIVGWTGNGTGALALQDWYIESNRTVATIYLRNLASAAASITGLSVDVLYVVDD